MSRDPAILAEVKRTLGLLKDLAPGHAVEVRVPPYAAIQCIEGPRHRRGTPPAVIEMDAQTWLDLARGSQSWGQAQGSGAVTVSGERADLSPYLPLAGA
jgi:hypothetical protein